MKRTAANCRFNGVNSEVTSRLHRALASFLLLVAAALPAIAQSIYIPEPERINAALRERNDVWGEAIIANGGATYENVKNYLPPLFFSTGEKNTELGVHNLLFAGNGGEPPYIVPIANGSRIYADRVGSNNFVEFRVASNGEEELYGDDTKRLEGPFLEDGYYPILNTAYTDMSGHRYSQCAFAATLPEMSHPVAFIEIRCSPNPSGGEAHLRRTYSHYTRGNVCDPLQVLLDIRGGSVMERMDAGGHNGIRRLIWSPRDPLPKSVRLDNQFFSKYKRACKAHWDGILKAGARFEVPERIVMDCQKNLLIQNLMMRWRYSLGAAVYHGDFYQPESSDALTTLGQFGFADAYRDGLRDILTKSKGADFYLNWERGEKLSHGAHYYWLTRDNNFIQANTGEYVEMCDALAVQIETDPNGMLHKQRQCGDIADVGYFPWHQTVCWRGLRDVAEVWRACGRDDLANKYRPIAERLQDAIANAVEKSQTTLPDGSIFVPRRLLEPVPEVFDPITDTKLGSYWNLCMPYAFASGFWEPNSPAMEGIVRYMHDHGSTLLGLLRFNYYPTAIGEVTSNGLPGYMTSGFDNVYLPAYVKLMADRDEAERLVLTFYSKLANGQTRNTFVSGEGDTAGLVPGMAFRSSYGSPCSANNTVFLQALRLMLVRESFDRATGVPKGLFLAHATPRQWLKPGAKISVSDAPTCFGKVSYTISSDLNNNRIHGELHLPRRNRADAVTIKLRAPKPHKLASIEFKDGAPMSVDIQDETFTLGAWADTVEFEATYE